MNSLDAPWLEQTFVAFDTETSGAYPMDAEVCELAAVKWQGGKIVGEYQTLVKPSRLIPDAIILIHGITNEMVASAPQMNEVVRSFYDFIKDSVLIAHHAPFDLGFMANEFEKANLALPTNQVVLCSSLISRKIFHDAENHKLQTLIKFLKIPQGTAHRALDDAKACLEVLLKACVSYSEREGRVACIADLQRIQEKKMNWKEYSIESLRESKDLHNLVSAISRRQEVEIIYSGGSKPGRLRKILPFGIVRNPDGDYIVAWDDGEQSKRFYLNRIKSVSLV